MPLGIGDDLIDQVLPMNSGGLAAELVHFQPDTGLAGGVIGHSGGGVAHAHHGPISCGRRPMELALGIHPIRQINDLAGGDDRVRRCRPEIGNKSVGCRVGIQQRFFLPLRDSIGVIFGRGESQHHDVPVKIRFQGFVDP